MSKESQPRRYAIYDVETLANLFTACFLDFQNGKEKEFVLYDDLSQLDALVSFLRSIQKHKYEVVGINNINFDSQIIEFILSNYDLWKTVGYSCQDIVSFIYGKAQDIINADEQTKREMLIPEYKLSIPQIDLFKQKHYDGKAKMGTSLKWLQFTMRYNTVEDMPIHHATRLGHNDIPTVLSYNWNDVRSTRAFFEKNLYETELRRTLSEKYRMNLMNASEPRLAKAIFAKFLCDEMDISYAQLKDMRTFRKQVRLRDVILPYVKFQSAELNSILEKIKATTINPNIGDTFDLEFDFGGIHTVLGLGGIHACCAPGVYETSEKWFMEDIDVTSFYPNLAIENNLRPKHLGAVFNKVYKSIFDERQKIPKKDPINYVFKIILNSTYGLSKEINSYLYDPFFTYSITINGQLSILMLVEQLVARVPGLKLYQENTDGVTIGYDPQYRDLVRTICDEWCALTRLQLEHAYYKKMVIRDVNNYMAIKTEFDWKEYQSLVEQGKRKDYGHIKHKGTFELELDYHKNPSMLVVPMAAESHFFGTLSYREFILKHNNIFDFLAGVKKKSDFHLNLHLLTNEKTQRVVIPTKQMLIDQGWLEWYGGSWIRKEWIDNHEPYDRMATFIQTAPEPVYETVPVYKKVPQQKVTRYYISNSGGVLTKDYHAGKKAGSRIQVESGWTVQPLNVVEHLHTSNYPDLERSYYIKEAERLVHSVEGNTAQLKLF